MPVKVMRLDDDPFRQKPKCREHPRKSGRPSRQGEASHRGSCRPKSRQTRTASLKN